MIYVSEPLNTVPSEYKTELQRNTYAALQFLDIPFDRVETGEVIAMADCTAINNVLDMKMVKTLFLCNRKQTDYYLFVTAGNKPFKAKEFADTLHVSRLSFAPARYMETILGTRIGSATIFSALLESARDVTFVVDKAVSDQEWYGCSDGTTTGYMKINTRLIMDVFLPYTGKKAIITQI